MEAFLWNLKIKKMASPWRFFCDDFPQEHTITEDVCLFIASEVEKHLRGGIGKGSLRRWWGQGCVAHHMTQPNVTHFGHIKVFGKKHIATLQISVQHRMRMQVKALDDVQGNDAPFLAPMQLLIAFTALQGLAQVAALHQLQHQVDAALLYAMAPKLYQVPVLAQSFVQPQLLLEASPVMAGGSAGTQHLRVECLDCHIL